MNFLNKILSCTFKCAAGCCFYLQFIQHLKSFIYGDLTKNHTAKGIKTVYKD